MKNKVQDKVFIKTSNYWAIHDFALFNVRSIIIGAKLEALYRLVQRRGEVVDWSSSGEFMGIKVLDYGEECFIDFIRTGFKDNSFYPCKLKIICFQSLGKINI